MNCVPFSVSTKIGIMVSFSSSATSFTKVPFSPQVNPPSILILSVLSFVKIDKLPVFSSDGIVTLYFISSVTVAFIPSTEILSILFASKGITTTFTSFCAPVSFSVTVMLVLPSAIALIFPSLSTVTMSVLFEIHVKSDKFLSSCLNTLYLSEITSNCITSFWLITILSGFTSNSCFPTKVYVLLSSVFSFPNELYVFLPAP